MDPEKINEMILTKISVLKVNSNINLEWYLLMNCNLLQILHDHIHVYVDLNQIQNFLILRESRYYKVILLQTKY